MKETQRQLAAFGSNLSSIGMKVGKLGGLMAIPFAASTKAFANFELQMASTIAVLKEAGATDKDVAPLIDLAKKLGRDTEFSAAQAAGAMKNFATAGLSAQQIFSAVGPTLDLAATAQIEIADAAKITTNVLKAAGIEAEDLTHVVDVLAKTYVKAGNTDIPLVGEALAKVLPLSKALKIPLEETTAAIAALSDQGIAAEEAGTGLRGVLASLVHPTNEAQAALDNLVGGKFQFTGLVDSIGKLEAGVKRLGLEGPDAARVLGDIFEARRLNSALALINRGAKSIREFQGAIADSAGTSGRIAKAQLDTITGATHILVSSIEGLAIEIGNALAPALRRVADIITGTVNGMAIFVKENREAIVEMATGAVKAVALGAALIAVGQAISLVASAFGVIAAAITFVFSPLGLLALQLGIVAAAFLKFSDIGSVAVARVGALFGVMKSDALKAFGGIAEALKAGDISLAFKIISALAKLEWLRIKGFADEMWTQIKIAALDTWDGITSAFEKAFILVSHVVQGIWTGLMADMMRGVNIVAGNVRHVFASLPGGGGAAEHKRIDEQTGKTQQGINAAELAQRVAQGRETLKDLNALDVRDKAAAEARQKEAARPKGLGIAAAQLAEAEGNLNALLAQAKQGTAAAPTMFAPTPALGGGAAAEAFTPEGLGAALEQSARKVDVAGAFGGAALEGLGAGSSTNDLLKDQKKEQEKTNAKLDKIGDRLRNNVVFQA